MSETDEKYMARMQRRYLDTVRPAMQQQFGYTNPMQVPRLEKIVINMGVGEAPAIRRSWMRRLRS